MSDTTCPELQRLRDELEAAYDAACLLPGAYSGKRMWVVRRRAAIERHIRKCKVCKGKR